MVYFYNSTEYFPLNQTSTGFYSVAAHEIYNMIAVFCKLEKIIIFAEKKYWLRDWTDSPEPIDI
jgi:hypothetical protein